jgi:glycosyltransferase involved in cell wall biosynthesis
MSTHERVSVIIPAWKAANIIGRALDSLRAQTRPPDEVIVVDDGSPDDIESAVRPYGSFVTYLRKENGGASSARNLGIDHATGDFIAFLDADDYWHPRKLETQLAIFREHPAVGLVSCRYSVIEPEGVTEYPPLTDAVWDMELSVAGAEAFAMGMVVWTSAMVVRREVLGSDRFEVGLKIAEDRDLWVRLVARTSIYLQSELLATLVAMSGSLSRSDLDLDCRSMLTMIDRHRDLLDARSRHRWEVEVYRRWAGSHLARGDRQRALLPAIKRLGHEPLSIEGWYVLGKAAVLSAMPRRIAHMAVKPQPSV